jgi:hypothetical protein
LKSTCIWFEWIYAFHISSDLAICLWFPLHDHS